MIKRVLIAAIAVIALSLAPQGSQAQISPVPGHQAIEVEIRAVMAEMRKAAERFDAPALYAHVMDTGTPPIIENGSIALTHAAALARTAQGLRGLSQLSYTYEKESITVLASNIVLWVGSGSSSATLSDGRRIVAPFAETIVLVKSESKWKVLHAHRSVPR